MARRMLHLRRIIHLLKSYKTRILTDWFNLIFHGGGDDDDVDDNDDDADDDGGIGGTHGDDIYCPMDGDSSDDELDDGDFLGQLLRHTKAKVLVASARGLANSEMMKKSAEELIYDRSKGCPKHWTVLRFILELLTLKAKHS